MLPVEAVPLVVAVLVWAFTLRLAARVEVEPPAPPPPAGDPFDALVVTTVVPRGYKAAQIIAGADRAWFAGIAHQVYGVDDPAVCARNGCAPPEPACACGFYAFTERIDALSMAARLSRHPVRAHALLQVEMSGDVLAFDHGVRGARQRVLGVELTRECHRCARRGRIRRAAGIGADRADRYRQLWTDLRRRALVSLPPGSAPVRPLCAEHLARASRTLTTAELGGLLGTEVRWRA